MQLLVIASALLLSVSFALPVASVQFNEDVEIFRRGKDLPPPKRAGPYPDDIPPAAERIPDRRQQSSKSQDSKAEADVRRPRKGDSPMILDEPDPKVVDSNPGQNVPPVRPPPVRANSSPGPKDPVRVPPRRANTNPGQQDVRPGPDQASGSNPGPKDPVRAPPRRGDSNPDQKGNRLIKPLPKPRT